MKIDGAIQDSEGTKAMNDGPLDFGSGYFFESQKVISDRRAARQLDQGRMRSSSYFESNNRSHAADAGGEWFNLIGRGILALLIGAGWLGWQILKLIGEMVSRRR